MFLQTIPALAPSDGASANQIVTAHFFSFRADRGQEIGTRVFVN
jgi:hypothetical protein